MITYKFIIITAFSILSCLTASSKDIISIEPTSITNLIDVQIVFTFKDGVTIDSLKITPVLNSEEDNFIFCASPQTLGQSLICTIKRGIGNYKFKYDKVLQDDISLLVEAVALLSINPTTTLTRILIFT